MKETFITFSNYFALIISVIIHKLVEILQDFMNLIIKKDLMIVKSVSVEFRK